MKKGLILFTGRNAFKRARTTNEFWNLYNFSSQVNCYKYQPPMLASTIGLRQIYGILVRFFLIGYSPQLSTLAH